MLRELNQLYPDLKVRLAKLTPGQLVELAVILKGKSSFKHRVEREPLIAAEMVYQAISELP